MADASRDSDGDQKGDRRGDEGEIDLPEKVDANALDRNGDPPADGDRDDESWPVMYIPNLL